MKNTSIRYVCVYIIFVAAYTAIYCFQNNHITLLDSAELGNFLSGFFAPLAFLYLFLGFRQQEKALNKTNKDLLKQLNIQESMLRLQIADQKAKEHAAQPIFKYNFSIQDRPYNSIRINPGADRPYETFQRIVTLDLTNVGEKVSQVSITCITPFRKSMNFNRFLAESDSLRSTLSINENDLDYYNEDNFLNLEIELVYATCLGLKYKIIYEVQISSLPDDMHLNYGGLLNTTRCN